MMLNCTNFLKSALKSKVLNYIISRYLTYFIQFINSLFIAVFLGPYYFGIWGFITLAIQYLNQLNFGISHSTSVIIAIHKSKEWYVKKVIGNSIIMLAILSLFISLFFLSNELFNLNIGNKYNFSKYAPVVLLIGILAYYNALFSNIFRVYGKVAEIAINQSSFPVLALMTIFLFEGENLLWGLLSANLIAFLFSLFLYIYRTPIKLKPIFSKRLARTIQTKGWYLFIYNTSFYLIIISTKSLISVYYSVEEFGYFTFAYNLANVVLLLLQSFSFLIFPKLINRMAYATSEKISELLEDLRGIYITTSHFLVHLAILFIPILITFFPQYSEASQVFKLTALTTIMFSNAFGYSGLLIAKGLVKKLGRLALAVLILNLVLVWSLISIFKINFTFAILGTMVANFVYLYLLTYMGRKNLQLKSDFLMILKDVYPLRIFLPFFLSFTFIFFDFSNYWFITVILLFLILNFKKLKKNKPLLMKILSKSDIIDV